MTPLETEIKRFADKQWPERTLPSRVSKLGEELGEFIEALCIDDTKELMREAGDCGIVMADLLAMKGSSLEAAQLWARGNWLPRNPFFYTLGLKIEALGYQYGLLGKAVYMRVDEDLVSACGKIACILQDVLPGTDLPTVMAQKFELVKMRHEGIFLS